MKKKGLNLRPLTTAAGERGTAAVEHGTAAGECGQRLESMGQQLESVDRGWRAWSQSCRPSQNRRQRPLHQQPTGSPADWQCQSVEARGEDGPEGAAVEVAAAEVL